MDYLERLAWVNANLALLTDIVNRLGAEGILRLRALHLGGEA